MKYLFTLLFFYLIVFNLKAQTDSVVVSVDSSEVHNKTVVVYTDTINVDLENDIVHIVLDTTEITIDTVVTGKDKIVHVRVKDAEVEINIPDTMVIQLGNYAIEFNDDYAEVKRRKKVKKPSSWRKLTYWAGLDIGVNGYVTSNFDFDVSDEAKFMALNWGNSRTFSINPLEWKIKIYHNYIGVVLGLGLEWNSYRLRNLNYAMAFNADSTYGVTPTNSGVNKSKFRTTYINAPFLLEFNTSQYRKNNFHISMGVVIGWRIDTMYKQRYENDGKHKDKTKGNWNVEPFRFNAMVRLGYGGLNFFATYGLNPLFRKGAGPELYQVSVGITMIGW